MRKILLMLSILGVQLYAQKIYASFNVEAARHADLAFTATGTVAKVNVEVASVVKKGEVLASLQNDELKAALYSAQIAATYAKKDFVRQQKVKKLVDAARFDQYAFKYESAKAKLAYQQALLDKTYLKAPFDGVIYSKSVEAGDAVSGAMLRTVMKIQSLRERKLVLAFDQKYWGRVKPGQMFRYRVDGDKQEYEGVITKVYPYADDDNRKIRAEVEAKDLVPGLFGDGYILIPDTK